MTKISAREHQRQNKTPTPQSVSQQSFPVKPLRTWIMVADMKVARIFAKNDNMIDPVGKIIRTQPEIRSATVTSAPGQKRQVYYYRYNRTQPAKTRPEPLGFAYKISAWLDEAIWNDAFDNMVLITPRPIQSTLYNTLSTPAQARILAVWDRDFTGQSTESIRQELAHLATH